MLKMFKLKLLLGLVENWVFLLKHRVQARLVKLGLTPTKELDYDMDDYLWGVTRKIHKKKGEE